MKKRNLAAGIFLLFLALPLLHADDSAIIQKALDGETIELSDGRRIHLIGVKTDHVQSTLQERFKLTPEKIASLPTTLLSSNAAEYMNNQAVGKSVVLSYDPANEGRSHKDTEGRILAYVWYSSLVQAGGREDEKKIFGVSAQNHLLNEELISLGHAIVDTSIAFVQKSAFLEAEQAAAKNKRGFWRSAAELYQDLLSQAAEAQFSSAAKLISKEAQSTNLEVAHKTLSDLIQQNPKDYRPYYERSWLGALESIDKISETNLEDASQAVELSKFNPKCYMQKSFLLYLLGKYDEGSRVYHEMLQIGGKMGMQSLITEMSQEKILKDQIADLPKDPKSAELVLDAIRATLNEDHFLLFMARYNSYGEEAPDEVKKVYQVVQTQARFQHFLDKNKELISSAKPRELVYKIQWALRGHRKPEEIMTWMETIGDAVPVDDGDEKDDDVIDMTGR